MVPTTSCDGVPTYGTISLYQELIIIGYGRKVQGCTKWGAWRTSPAQVKPNDPINVLISFSSQNFKTNIVQIWVVYGRFVRIVIQITRINDTTSSSINVEMVCEIQTEM